MIPANYPLRMEAGVDWSASFRLRNADGTYVDMTGCTSKLVVRQGGAAVLTVVASVNSTTGRISAVLTGEQTATLSGLQGLTYQWDYADSGAFRRRPLQGSVVVSPGVVALP